VDKLSLDMQGNFVRLLDAAPRVECPRCQVTMTLRTLVPVPESSEYTAAYRCAQCGIDTQREFTFSDSSAPCS
jgi:DNA-directed RNA polymerase subunit RPC12/RpoP